MNTSSNSAISRVLRASLLTVSIALPIVASADQPNIADDSRFDRRDNAPLIDKVRKATTRYLNINNALNELPEHWVVATPCVSGPNEGAMGVHLVKPSRLGVTDLKGDEPQALIYEPLSNGGFRLVGVEFILFVDNWESNHPPGTTPAVDGHLTNFVEAPNRYGLKPFYELHVWAWEHNPKGSFADFNTQVTCERQQAPN